MRSDLQKALQDAGWTQWKLVQEGFGTRTARVALGLQAGKLTDVSLEKLARLLGKRWRLD